jgi:hypothetical protein
MKKPSAGPKNPLRLKTRQERNQSKLNKVNTRISKLESSQKELNKQEYLNKAASRITGVSESSLAQGKLGQLQKKKQRIENMITPGRQKTVKTVKKGK